MDAFDLRQWKEFATAGGSLAEPAIINQVVIDSRRIDSPHSLFVALKGQKEDGHHYVSHAAQGGAKFALVALDWQPPCPPPDLTILRVANPLRAFQSIAQTYRLNLPMQIIGITGSFGKTMVKDFLYALLSSNRSTAASPESFNSQIGVPLSLLSFKKQHEIGIIEAAISEHHEMDILADLIRPDYTILTPIGKKHLATLQDLQTITHEIMKLIQVTGDHGWSLLPRDPHLERYLSSLRCPYFFWDEPHDQLPHASRLESSPLSTYHLSFPHLPSYQGQMTTGYAYMLNLLNMAIKAAWLVGIPYPDMISTLENYHPEPMRTEIWKCSIGSTFINDTYGSDPQSVDHALRYFDYASKGDRKMFVFGGIRGDHSSSPTTYRRMGQAFAKSHLDYLFLVGQQPFQPLTQKMESLSPETKILAFEDHEQVLTYLYTHRQPQDFVIFKGENKLSFDRLTQRFNGSLINNQCTINLAAIQTNLTLIRKKLAPQTRLMVMVKAFAYGTDQVRIAKFLTTCNIDILGVSYVDEGVALKRIGIEQAVFSIHATADEAWKVVYWGLEVGVSDAPFITALAEEASKQEKRVKVHLHVNTGMGRFGCRPEEALTLAYQIHSYSSLELEGLMTHFACADDPKEDDFTRVQISLFDHVIDHLRTHHMTPPWIHAANSSATLRFDLPHYNMVRLGLAVYGLYVSDAAQQVLDLRLALSLTSRIIGMTICKQGETVGYGRRYQVTREEQKIAVLPIGYFDGLHRNYSNKGYVLIQGQRAPMIGTICMDYMMIDVTDLPQVEIGSKVLIFGEDEFGYYLSPEELAQSGNSIVHELITCLGPRIERIFVYEEGKQIR